jgi:uncharacterized protein YoxC
MFPASFDNNTIMLMIAVALVIAATVYMYRELQKTKQDLNSVKTMSTAISSRLASFGAQTAPREEAKVKTNEEKDD